MGLNDSKLIRVLDENSTYGILKKHKLEEARKYTREDLAKIAGEGGVSYTASGSLMKAGGSIIIMVTLQNPRADEAVNPIKVTCQNEAEILPRIDELVAKIKSGMNISADQLDADVSQALGKLTTSPEALKYWMTSWPHYKNGDYAKVVALCERAVELDPNFASAYINLASGYEGLGNSAKALEYRKRAFELRDRLPERERLFVEAYYYIATANENTWAKAIEAFEKYLVFEPNDVGALQPLGYLYQRSGNRAKYLELYDRCYRLDPSPWFLTNLMIAYQQTGQPARAEEILKDYYKNFQDNPSIQRVSCNLYIVLRNFQQALAEIERGFLQEPSPATWSWDNLKGDVYLAQDNLAAAEREYLRVIQKAEKPRYVSAATRNLIRLHILQGRMSRAADELAKATAPGGSMEGAPGFAWIRVGKYDKALEIYETWLKNAIQKQDPESIRVALLNKAVVYVETKAFGDAEKIAGELKSLGQKSPYKQAMYPYLVLRGLIDLEQGDFGRAIDNLNGSSGWFDSEFFGPSNNAFYIYPLAFAYYKFGDLPKAREEFEKLTNLTAGRWT